MRITDRKESPIIGLTGMGGGLASYILYGTAAPKIGEAYGGGYFAGQLDDSGTIYNLVVAPAVSPRPGGGGNLEGQYGGSTPGTIQWKTTNTGPDTTATSHLYGGTATVANANSSHPMFNWAVNNFGGPNAGTYDASNTTGTGIGGYNDWYIPARYELELLYRNFKPTTEANTTGLGANPHAVPPTSNYTSGDPAQTTVADFQAGGAEAFSTSIYYWNATESIYQTQCWAQWFDTGLWTNSANKFESFHARAVRRVAA